MVRGKDIRFSIGKPWCWWLGQSARSLRVQREACLKAEAKARADIRTADHLMDSVAYSLSMEDNTIPNPNFRRKQMSDKMSHDRVQFTLSSHNLSKGRTAYRRILKQAFGTEFDTHNFRGKALVIVCRPSQFARFMVYRNEAIQTSQISGCNTFAEMDPKLFTPDSCEDPVDVSKNPHCYK